MIKLKKLIKEHAWDRKFGEALPTLSDVAKKHQKTEENCGCGGHETSCKCEVKEEVVSEGPDEIKRSKKGLLKLQKAETKFRDKMFELEQIILQDPTMGNLKLARRIKDSYKSGVTKFMREATSIVKKIK
jgi:hypothetical protein